MTELKQDRSPHEAATDTVRRGMPSIAGAGSTWAIEAHGLRKSFGNQVVLDDIDFAVAKGTVFALLGPNGSGKTTTVQILSTLLPADGGVVRVAGYDVTRQPDLVRHSIGVTGQFSAVDNLLTGTENLLLMADLAHLERRAMRRRTTELLERFELARAADKTAATYSGGMRRRLDLAMTLIAEPRIIFLDEPTTGLDPRSRHTMWEIVRELTADGVTIFLTTQHLDEADRLADRVAVLDGGHIVAEGTPTELKRRVPGGHVELHFADPAALVAATDVIGPDGAEPDLNALVLKVPTDGAVSSLREFLMLVEQGGVPVESVSVQMADLDDVFFTLTGRADRRCDTITTTDREEVR
jgi:ABC-2 type transport system ATP-binding protein